MQTGVAGILAILFTVALITNFATSCGRADKVGEVVPGGMWLDEMRRGIEEHITNGDTAVRLLAEVDRLEEEVLAFDAATIAYYDRLKALDRSYNSSRRDFEVAIDDFNAVRVKHRNRVLDVRFRMRELTTADEWKALSDIDATLLSQWQREFEL